MNIFEILCGHKKKQDDEVQNNEPCETQEQLDARRATEEAARRALEEILGGLNLLERNLKPIQYLKSGELKKLYDTDTIASTKLSDGRTLKLRVSRWRDYSRPMQPHWEVGITGWTII